MFTQITLPFGVIFGDQFLSSTNFLSQHCLSGLIAHKTPCSSFPYKRTRSPSFPHGKITLACFPSISIFSWLCNASLNETPDCHMFCKVVLPTRSSAIPFNNPDLKFWNVSYYLRFPKLSYYVHGQEFHFIFDVERRTNPNYLPTCLSFLCAIYKFPTFHYV